MPDSMALQVEIESPYSVALEQVTDALKQEGFGVLTRIDIHEALSS